MVIIDSSGGLVLSGTVSGLRHMYTGVSLTTDATGDSAHSGRVESRGRHSLSTAKDL